MLEAGLAFLKSAPLTVVALGLFLENVLIFVLALGGGALAVRLFASRRVALPAPATTGREWLVAWTVVVLNTAVTVLGLVLWRRGVISFRTDTGVRALLDTVVLLVVMDLAMYVLHRVAHHPLLYSWMHRLHHEFGVTK